MSLGIAVIGTFDSKGEELSFLKDSIVNQGFEAITINLGTRSRSRYKVDVDLFSSLPPQLESRDQRIEEMISRSKAILDQLHKKGRIFGAIGVGGGSGTYLVTEAMKVLPLGFPKVMVSTVASRDMSRTVGTKDITMIHSVFDMLGVTSLSSTILKEAAACVCAMAAVFKESGDSPSRPRIGLTLFGFITEAAMNVKELLEEKGYEVIPFHANGTGGLAMEWLAKEGYFRAIVDLATHELSDTLLKGYCAAIGPGRLENVPGSWVPRLVVPGGLDCAVLEFDRENIPEALRDRQIFFYDFRSAIRLNEEETRALAKIFGEKLNTFKRQAMVLVPTRGWSEADGEGRPLHNPRLMGLFLDTLRSHILDTRIVLVDLHINDRAFAQEVVRHLELLLKEP